jgi:arylsulfatase
VSPRRAPPACVLSCVALHLAAPACRPAARPLVLLITVDTLRADHVGAYGDARGLTPRLDRLAAESLVFERAYATASFTLPSLASLLTSRYPEEVGVDGNSSVLAPAAPPLAEHLQARGFATGAVVSNYVLRPASGFGRGFGAYDATFPQREAVRPVPERRAPETTAAALQALDRLRQAGKPTFLWVHYQDPHGPYTPPDALRERGLERERARSDGARELAVSRDQHGDGAIPKYQYLDPHRDAAFYRAGYAGEVAHADTAIGALLDGLAGRGLLERAVVVFASDHGEALGEEDYWFSHGERLGDALVRVPLLVRAPGVAPGRRRDVASLLDVFPTLASLLSAPVSGSRGRDLLAPRAARQASAVYMSTLKVSDVPREGLVDFGFKYLVEAAGEPRERLFRTGDESTDLAAAEPQALGRMRAALAAARSSLARVAASRQRLTPEEEAAFGTLGYVPGR